MDPQMTYEEMLQLLSTGEGIDLENFDRKGRKPLLELFKEIKGREVILIKNIKTGCIRRVAQSVRVIIRTQDKYSLHEKSRAYPDGTVVNELKEWSISETRKKGESIVDAAIRGLKEELGLDVTPEQLEIKAWAASDGVDIHPSSAYPGIESCVLAQYVGLVLPTRLWPEGHTIIDGETKISFGWVPIK